MANSTTKVTNQSSGIYFNEIDLTFAQANAGTFAGGAIVTSEKGPAFEVITSTDMSQRTKRFGGLNPNFTSSYYADAFLTQANNYKEIRLLGLEGYSDSDYSTSGLSGYAVTYDVTGVAPQVFGPQSPLTITAATATDPVVLTTSTSHNYVSGNRVVIASVTGMTEINGNFLITVINATQFSLTGIDGTAFTAYVSGGTVTRVKTPLTASAESIACILKPRKTIFTGKDPIYSVEVRTYTDPSTLTTAATDDKFTLRINYGISSVTSTQDVVCSLRPDSKEYITKVFGTDPLDGTRIGNDKSPLWVEYVMPSVTSKLRANDSESYYYPGETNPSNSFSTLDLMQGYIGFNTTFSYAGFSITGATNASPIVVTVPSHNFIDGDTISITGVTGNTNANGTFVILNSTNTTFELYEEDGITPVAGNAAYVSGGTAKIKYSSTWETESTDFSDTSYQTPVTPWFVSDVDSNLEYKKLFKIWSISDGVSANTEIKVEIANIDPSAKNGKGQFDIIVRLFNDREDVEKQVVDAFTRLTMDPFDDDYILRRIGDGENFPRVSEWIFVEINEDDVLPDSALPYGVEGYPNSTGLVFPEIAWTREYDLGKPIRKQSLGLSNNKINTFHSLAGDQLKYRNTTGSDSISKGFHLNENAPTSKFVVAPLTTLNQVDSNGDPLDQFVTNPQDNKERLKFVVALAGGFDGWNLYNERNFNSSSSKDYEALQMAVDKFADKEDLTVDFSVLVSPVSYRKSNGELTVLNMDEHLNACELIDEMVISRGDSLYVVDFAYDVESLPSTAANTIKFSAQNLRNSYTCAYYPWLQLTDSTNKVNPWIPPSYMALATIAATAIQEAVWQPPAGVLRTISDNIIRPRKRMKINDREILKEFNINPITNFPGSGLEITESRTLQERFSALSFIHNRLLLGYAKKALNQTLRPLLHQLKGEVTDSAFINTVTPIFDRIKKQNGISKFEVSVLPPQGNTAEDRVTLRGQIKIFPLYPVERIIVDFVLEDDSFQFNTEQTQ